MKVIINDEPTEIEPGTTVADLLALRNLHPKFLAVERNLNIVPRAEHDTCVLAEGDRLEIVTLAGGG